MKLQLRSEVLKGANELRLMLCKEKRNATTGTMGQSVVAACGACRADGDLLIAGSRAWASTCASTILSNALLLKACIAAVQIDVSRGGGKGGGENGGP